MFDKIIIPTIFICKFKFQCFGKKCHLWKFVNERWKNRDRDRATKKNSKAKNFVHTTALWRDCVYYTFIHMYESHWMSENQSSFVSIFSLFFFLLSSRSRKCVMSIEKHHRLAFLVRVKILKSLVSV